MVLPNGFLHGFLQGLSMVLQVAMLPYNNKLQKDKDTLPGFPGLLQTGPHFKKKIPGATKAAHGTRSISKIAKKNV